MLTILEGTLRDIPVSTHEIKVLASCINTLDKFNELQQRQTKRTLLFSSGCYDSDVNYSLPKTLPVPENASIELRERAV